MKIIIFIFISEYITFLNSEKPGCIVSYTSISIYNLNKHYLLPKIVNNFHSTLNQFKVNEC